MRQGYVCARAFCKRGCVRACLSLNWEQRSEKRVGWGGGDGILRREAHSIEMEIHEVTPKIREFNRVTETSSMIKLLDGQQTSISRIV